MKFFHIFLIGTTFINFIIKYTLNLEIPERTNPIYKMKSYYGSFYLGIKNNKIIIFMKFGVFILNFYLSKFYKFYNF